MAGLKNVSSSNLAFGSMIKYTLSLSIWSRVNRCGRTIGCSQLASSHKLAVGSSITASMSVALALGCVSMAW